MARLREPAGAPLAGVVGRAARFCSWAKDRCSPGRSMAHVTPSRRSRDQKLRADPIDAAGEVRAPLAGRPTQPLRPRRSAPAQPSATRPQTPSRPPVCKFRKKLFPNCSPKRISPAQSPARKQLICRDFLRSGRQDLNLRPPGPQSEGWGCARWITPVFVGCMAAELLWGALKLDPTLDPKHPFARAARQRRERA
jgi:hypothetical protein